MNDPGLPEILHQEEVSALYGSARMIAGHSDCPEKPGILEDCLQDVDRMHSEGRITEEQRREIYLILLGS